MDHFTDIVVLVISRKLAKGYTSFGNDRHVEETSYRFENQGKELYTRGLAFRQGTVAGDSSTHFMNMRWHWM